MQFRLRRRVIQVIRTAYDPALKRGRSEVVGRLDKEAPVIDDALRAACTEAELAEVSAFLEAHRDHQSRQEASDAASRLPESMRQAEAWFRRQPPDAAAAQRAAEVWTAWQDLEKALIKLGVGPSKRVGSMEKPRG